MSKPRQPGEKPANEKERLEALYRYDVLDTGSEEVFDSITRLASYIAGTPIALISLVDSDRQWFKSKVGLDADETPRDISFCQFAIFGDELFEVPNATEHEVLKHNPLVTDAPNIRFYAGAPLQTPDGLGIGTLCVIDSEPKELSEEQRDALTILSNEVVANLELRVAAIDAQKQAQRMRLIYDIAASGATLDEQIHETLSQVCQLFELEMAVISHIEEETYTIEYVYAPGTELAPGQTFALGDTYCALTMDSDGPVSITSMGESEYKGHPAYQAFGLETYFGTKLWVDGEVYGTVNFSMSAARKQLFGESDIDYIQLVSRWLSANFERNRAQKRFERANLELERSNRELDDFAYIASHDLKAPLRAIKNLAQWVSEDNAEVLSESSKEDMELLQQRAGRMENLLEDLLEYSRVGRVVENPEPIDTAILVSDVIDMLAPPQSFEIEASDTLPIVSCPRAPLEKIFRNLIGNALKHHDRESGKIEVSANKTDNGFVEFVFADDGPGIPEEYHEQLFEMFKTLKSRDEVEGSGMGLSFVKKTVLSFGGNIKIESDGRGTKFIVAIPEEFKTEKC